MITNIICKNRSAYFAQILIKSGFIHPSMLKINVVQALALKYAQHQLSTNINI